MTRYTSSSSGGTVTAPKVEGYRFLIWLHAVAKGWVGSVYFEYPTRETTKTWLAADTYGSGGGAVDCFALYVKTG